MKLTETAINRAVGDFGHVELGDPRRSERVRRVVARLARNPAAPLPVALGQPAEVEGAYRLMNNPAVNFEVLVAAQAEATRQRAEEADDVIVVHDTTDCSFSSLDPEEIGFLQTGKAGFRLHVSLVLDARNWRRPLGVIHAEAVIRSKRRREGTRKRKISGAETAKWTDREFARWWRGMSASGEELRQCQRAIHVADREGDSYELMANLLGCQQQFVIRLRVDRRARTPGAGDDDWGTARQVVNGCEGVLERDVVLSSRRKETAPKASKAHPARKMRVARLRFSATQIEIPRPNYLHAPVPDVLNLNLVRVSEPEPPSGQPAVEWLLYTTEPISTPEDVAKVVDIYRTRWAIEEFNAALKTGCAYEQRHFESRHALLTMLALLLPIACEILWLRSRARSNPTAPASEVLTPLQIRVLRELGPRKLAARLNAEEAMLAVAGLGGHQPNNGPPGWKVLYRGMVLLVAHEAGWRAAERSILRRDL